MNILHQHPSLDSVYRELVGMSSEAVQARRERLGVGSPQRHVRDRLECTPVYPVSDQHAADFFAHLCERGAALPSFVEVEFEHCLRRSRLEGGFVRVQCRGCRHEQRIAFSCTRRAFCPSCAARRRVETATRLVDRVFLRVAVRQWVVTFPWPLRLLVAARSGPRTAAARVPRRRRSRSG